MGDMTVATNPALSSHCAAGLWYAPGPGLSTPLKSKQFFGETPLIFPVQSLISRQLEPSNKSRQVAVQAVVCVPVAEVRFQCFVSHSFLNFVSGRAELESVNRGTRPLNAEAAPAVTRGFELGPPPVAFAYEPGPICTQNQCHPKPMSPRCTVEAALMHSIVVYPGRRV